MRKISIPLGLQIILYILAIALGVAAIAWYAYSRPQETRVPIQPGLVVLWAAGVMPAQVVKVGSTTLDVASGR